MNTLPQTSGTIGKALAIFFLPILLAFTIGSLPVLLPLMLYRLATGVLSRVTPLASLVPAPQAI